MPRLKQRERATQTLRASRLVYTHRSLSASHVAAVVLCWRAMAEVPAAITQAIWVNYTIVAQGFNGEWPPKAHRKDFVPRVVLWRGAVEWWGLEKVFKSLEVYFKENCGDWTVFCLSFHPSLVWQIAVTHIPSISFQPCRSQPGPLLPDPGYWASKVIRNKPLLVCKSAVGCGTIEMHLVLARTVTSGVDHSHLYSGSTSRCALFKIPLSSAASVHLHLVPQPPWTSSIW